MRRVLAALVRAVPFDRKSCRAIDEAFLDWAHEETEPRARRFASIRGLLAVTRATVRCTMWELARVPLFTIFSRALVLIVFPTLLLASLGWGHAGSPGPAVATEAHAVLTIAAAVQILFVLSPVALFLVLSRGLRDDAVPTFGAAVLAMATLLVVGAFIVPVANRKFHAVEATARNRERPTLFRDGRPSPSPGDMGPAALIATASNRPVSTAGGVLLFRTGVSILGAVLVVLASIVSQITPSRRRRWTAGIAVVYGLFFAVFPAAWEFGSHAHPAVGLMPWFLSGGAVLSAIALGRGLVTELDPRLPV
jgi:hypothetical protein